ncbi:MAG: hypothetical protein ACTS44_00975 [Candidatus Hodgkinia cicadicola]
MLQKHFVNGRRLINVNPNSVNLVTLSATSAPILPFASLQRRKLLP